MLCVLTWSYIVNNDPDRLYRYDLHLMHGSGRGSVVVRREVRAASVGSASVVHYFGRGGEKGGHSVHTQRIHRSPRASAVQFSWFGFVFDSGNRKGRECELSSLIGIAFSRVTLGNG